MSVCRLRGFATASMKALAYSSMAPTAQSPFFQFPPCGRPGHVVSYCHLNRLASLPQGMTRIFGGYLFYMATVRYTKPYKSPVLARSSGCIASARQQTRTPSRRSMESAATVLRAIFSILSSSATSVHIIAACSTGGFHIDSRGLLLGATSPMSTPRRCFRSLRWCIGY